MALDVVIERPKVINAAIILDQKNGKVTRHGGPRFGETDADPIL